MHKFSECNAHKKRRTRNRSGAERSLRLRHNIVSSILLLRLFLFVHIFGFVCRCRSAWPSIGKWIHYDVIECISSETRVCRSLLRPNIVASVRFTCLLVFGIASLSGLTVAKWSMQAKTATTTKKHKKQRHEKKTSKNKMRKRANKRREKNTRASAVKTTTEFARPRRSVAKPSTQRDVRGHRWISWKQVGAFLSIQWIFNVFNLVRFVFHSLIFFFCVRSFA